MLSAQEQLAIVQALRGERTLLASSPRARDHALFAVAARLARRPVLVASPLAAELYRAAQATLGAGVIGFGSFVKPSARPKSRARLLQGGSLLVVVEPAQLRERDLREAVAKAPLGLLGIAGAHGGSELAHELAPGYLGLGPLCAAFGAVPLLAVTTRCAERVLGAVAEALSISARSILRAPPPELELSAQVVRPAERRAALFAAIQAFGAPGIVLTATPQEADALFGELGQRGIPALRAHSGMAAEERSAALARFAAPGARLVLVSMSPHANPSGIAGPCEVDLGLGSHPPRADLSFVIHYQAPLSLEQHFEDLAWLPPGGRSLTFADSGDAALVQALLAQQRLRPAAIESVVQALLSPTAGARPAAASALALRAGISRRALERVLATLEGRALCQREGEQISSRVSSEALLEEARQLGAAFSSLRAADAERSAAVATYVTSRHRNDTRAPALSPAQRAQ